MVPFFIFSLPRSGSTLLQRILAGHREISSVSEPWILLPLLYTLKSHGVNTEYSHSLSVEALEDFCKKLPAGKGDYLAEVRNFVLRLYEKRSDKSAAKYFLDKTPRYHLICNEIIHLFPDGKFIFLWRNPLAIIASMITTWHKGNWKIFKLKVDLFDGVEHLEAAFIQHQGAALSVQYEHLINDPEYELGRIFNYLELKKDPDLINTFTKVDIEGPMGDSTGARSYKELNQEPLEKWKTVLNNPFRKAWCKRYLKWVGHERLKVMGYELDGLLAELDALPNDGMLRLPYDLIMAFYGLFFCGFDVRILKKKWKLLPDWKWVKGHS